MRSQKCYDSQGRRAYKKVSINGNVTLHQRYIYRDYLQIACLDLTRSNHPALWFIVWDPSQPAATRPLAIRKDGTWFTYGWDLTKNICEVYDSSGFIATTYNYAPFGHVSTIKNVSQPVQWSSEFFDVEIGLIYYNYRYYLPNIGCWLQRDSLGEIEKSLYKFTSNSPILYTDELGQKITLCFAYDLGKVVGIDTGKANDKIKQYSTNMKEVFSGNIYANNACYQHVADKGPIPIGRYKIERQITHDGHTPNGNWKWYPLSPYVNGEPSSTVEVSNPFNKDEVVKRGEFFMHAGNRSDGCVTFRSYVKHNTCGPDPDDYPQSHKYKELIEFIENSTTPAGYRVLFVKAKFCECEELLNNIIENVRESTKNRRPRRRKNRRR